MAGGNDMARTWKRFFALVLLASFSWGHARENATTPGRATTAGEGSVPAPALPGSSSEVPTVDVGNRAIRSSAAGGARDVLPPGGAPIAVLSSCVPQVV